MQWKVDNAPRCGKGFTLLEVLIATTITLLLMLGLAQIFKVLGDSITKGRAGLELNNRLRNVVHRIRTDLDNVTVTPTPPAKVGAGQGYMKYYDGPGADMTFAGDPRINRVGIPLLNRFGDIDDIFMATIKAQDAWFTGRVPRFLVERRAPANMSELDEANFVTISSQYAEVAIFVQPEVAQSPNGLKDNRNLAVNPAAYVDQDGDGFPDRFRLHYRLLLIRPDLNLADGKLPGFPAYDPSTIKNPPPGNRLMIAGTEEINSTILPDFTCDMYRIHQYCDLSIRRVYDPADGLAGNSDYVAANNLEDLSNPINRFAHVVYPLNAQGQLEIASPVYRTFPLLALTPPLPFQQLLFEDGGVGQVPSVAGSGLLHPAFALMGNRAGEDILATDVLAFDVKAFDASCPMITFVGQDGEPGVGPPASQQDDNGNGIVNRGPGGTLDLGELGWIGSDDVVLRPSDPGFLSFGLPGIPPTSNGGAPMSAITANGEFVDLCWGSAEKLASGITGSIGFNDLTLAQRRVISTELSGVAVSNTGVRDFTGSLYKSGMLKRNAAGRLLVYQPCYDTFSDLFERDGVFQAQIYGPGTAVSLTGILGNQEAWRTVIDAGYDGVDNNNTVDDPNRTADDIGERETSPPFATNLRGIQISVRLEDRATKQFKQMSTVKEFVTR